MINTIIKYFKEICSIPHESKNEGKIVNYLINFAKQNNLSYYADSFNNVLIKKVNKNRKPIILQAHTDMVCVSENDYNINFSTTPIKVIETDDYLYAYKTSLGADNGLGVAIILSLLSSENSYSIEALFTADEEVTMTGALNFDYSLLKGKQLISLDGFNSNQIITGCASICDMLINFTPKFNKVKKSGYKLTIKGLKGGHSGEDINKNIGNAINILANMLLELDCVLLSTFNAGKQFNFIPNYAIAEFCATNIEPILKLKKEYESKYKNLEVIIEKTSITQTITQEQTKQLLKVLNSIITGVIKKNASGEIEVSQNLASISLEEGFIKINERAHNEKSEQEQISFLKNLAETNNCTFTIFDIQPGLIQNNTNLAKSLIEVNKNVFGQELVSVKKNVSLEGAIFKQKIKDVEIAIVSPDIYDVHSTKERVYIPSIQKTYTLLQNFLK